MRVLITGGAGFIGAHLGRALQERGDEVTVLDNFNDYYDPRLKRARLDHVYRTPPVVHEVDLADAAHVREAVERTKPDTVVHFGAWAGVRPSREYPEIFAAANVQGTVNVFEACRRARVRRFLFASSSSVYGPDAPVPSPEAAVGSRQSSGYGVSKRAGELYGALYHTLDGLPVTCLRFFTVYGPWGRPDMACWKFTERILRGAPIRVHLRSRDGREVRRDFTEIRDVVRGTVAALEKDVPWAVINLGAANSIPLRRFVAAIEAAAGKPARIEEHVLPEEESVSTAADLTEARRLLGFSPAVSLEDGIARFVHWYEGEFQRRFPDGLRSSQYWS